MLLGYRNPLDQVFPLLLGDGDAVGFPRSVGKMWAERAATRAVPAWQPGWAVPGGLTAAGRQDRSVSAPDIDESVVEPLRAIRAASRSTVLLGAGASASSGLPQWNQLAVQLLLRSGAVSDEDVAAVLVERQDPLLAAEAARTAAGEGWYPLVREALYPADVEVVPSSLHLASAGLLLGTEWPTRLATLNFDTLLEQALRTAADDSEMRADVRSRVEAATDGQYDVHHLHGYITPDHAEQVVLTMTDFIDLVGDVDCWQRRYVQRAVDAGSLVIAGTSYRDPDVRQWVSAALRNGPAEHGAVVLLARESFRMTRRQYDSAGAALRAQWTAAGIEPVLLHDHDDVAQVLRELPHLLSTGYRPPNVRAQVSGNSWARTSRRCKRDTGRPSRPM